MASGATRILLVTANDEEAQTLTAALSADGGQTTRVGTISEAAEALQNHGFDVVILCQPLPDADVIGSCTLAQDPAAPPLILLDAIDATEAIESTVPSEMWPERILTKPIDSAKLADVVREVLDAPEEGVLLTEPGFDRLAQLLVDLTKRARTGTLEVRADGVVTRIHFQSGLPVGAEGGSLRETLGRMLLRKRTLSEADYVRVIERMTEQVFDNEQLRMGEALVELGLLSKEEMEAALAEQVSERVTACFQWRCARFEFEEMDEPPSAGDGFDIPPIEALVLRGLRLYVPPEEIEARLHTHLGKRARLSRPVDDVISLFQIEPAQQGALALLDGSRTVGELLEGGEHAQLVGALVWTGSAEFVAEKKPAARPSPDRRGRLEFAREVVMPRRKAKSAAEKRSGGEDKPDESKAMLEAEQLFRRAQSYLSAEKFVDTLRTMTRVVELQPNEPEYRMVEAWTLYLQARVDLRVARAKAVARARRVTQADPQAAKPHAILGRLALDDGNQALATKEFQAALVRDPEDADAQRGMKRVRGSG